MSQQRQTQRETGESNDETEELQRTLMENGRKAMRQFVELPLQQSLQFQRSAAELFVNGLEAQKWAQERGIELTKNTMGNYLQTLDDVTQNAEDLARTEIAAGQQQGQAIQQAMGQFQSGGEAQRQPSSGQGMGDQQPPGGQAMTGQRTGGQQQPPEMGQQASMGGLQQPQRPQPQEIGQQQPQPQGLGQQQPPQPQRLQQPLGQQPSPQAQPAPQAAPEPTEATQQGSRSEEQQSEGLTQTESPAETK